MSNTLKLTIPKGESRTLRWAHTVTASEDNLTMSVNASGQATASASLPIDVLIQQDMFQISYSRSSTSGRPNERFPIYVGIQNKSTTEAIQNPVLEVEYPDIFEPASPTFPIAAFIGDAATIKTVTDGTRGISVPLDDVPAGESIIYKVTAAMALGPTGTKKDVTIRLTADNALPYEGAWTAWITDDLPEIT